MSRIAVLTPTYNRANVITRLYSSLEASSFKDFEWIIVDDGSIDNTKNVIEELQKKSSFTIRYYYQQNQGKSRAMNYLFDLAESDYCFQIDDDDELLPDAMEKGLHYWDSMDPAIAKKTWNVIGRCINSENKQMVGKPYPDNVNSLDPKRKNKIIKQCAGEKCGLLKVSVLKNHKFPEIDGCNFIFESFLWDQINEEYEQFYTNEIFRIYHVPQMSGDNLSNRNKNKSKERALSDYYLHKYILQECPNKYKFLSKKYLRSIVYAKTNADLAQISNKELLAGLGLREKATLLFFSIPIRIFRK